LGGIRNWERLKKKNKGGNSVKTQKKKTTVKRVKGI